jgi:hypothetical protein
MAPARSETDYYEMGAGLGPQWFLGWSEEDRGTIIKALRAMKGMPGIDEMLMARQARVIEKIEHPAPFLFYGANWEPMQLTLLDPWGHPWATYQITLPEWNMIRKAVLNDRYCRAEEQDMALWECYMINRDAINLYERMAAMRHILPGGAKR